MRKKRKSSRLPGRPPRLKKHCKFRAGDLVRLASFWHSGKTRYGIFLSHPKWGEVYGRCADVFVLDALDVFAWDVSEMFYAPFRLNLKTMTYK